MQSQQSNKATEVAIKAVERSTNRKEKHNRDSAIDSTFLQKSTIVLQAVRSSGAQTSAFCQSSSECQEAVADFSAEDACAASLLAAASSASIAKVRDSAANFTAST